MDGQNTGANNNGTQKKSLLQRLSEKKHEFRVKHPKMVKAWNAAKIAGFGVGCFFLGRKSKDKIHVSVKAIEPADETPEEMPTEAE